MHDKRGTIILGVYVDDIIVGTSNDAMFNWFWQKFGLLKGTKVLVAWPGGSNDWHVWERPVETAWAIARAILSKLGASMMG